MKNERVIKTFLDLVQIDSPSKKEGEVANYCKQELEALGCNVRIDDTASATGSNTGNVIATLPATDEDAPVLILSAHMDCVDPCEGVVPHIDKDEVIRSKGETILGGDDKVGLAAAIEAIRLIKESGKAHPEIRLVFTVQEEVGLIGAKHLSDESLKDCDLCLVLDADGDIGGVVIGAPFHHTFTATFTGKASHAGVAPEKGVSAIKMAAAAVDAIEVGRIDEHTTANIGTIKGGSADNVIAESCTLTGECRSLVREKAQATHDAMDAALKAAARAAGGSVEISWDLEYDGFLYDENSPEVTFIKEAATALGFQPKATTTGGGSDANILAGKGVPVLVLSTGMNDVHSTNESIKVSDIEGVSELLVQIAATFESFSGKAKA